MQTGSTRQEPPDGTDDESDEPPRLAIGPVPEHAPPVDAERWIGRARPQRVPR